MNTFETYYRLQPQTSWPMSDSLRVAARYMREAEGHKAKLEAELAFINKAVEVVMFQPRHTTRESLRELFEDMGEIQGLPAYDGSDPVLAMAWIRDGLESAGVGDAGQKHLYDDPEVAAIMEFVPTDAFDAVLDEAEKLLRAMLPKVAAEPAMV